MGTISKSLKLLSLAAALFAISSLKPSAMEEKITPQKVNTSIMQPIMNEIPLNKDEEKIDEEGVVNCATKMLRSFDIDSEPEAMVDYLLTLFNNRKTNETNFKCLLQIIKNPEIIVDATKNHYKDDKSYEDLDYSSGATNLIVLNCLIERTFKKNNEALFQFIKILLESLGITDNKGEISKQYDSNNCKNLLKISKNIKKCNMLGAVAELYNICYLKCNKNNENEDENRLQTMLRFMKFYEEILKNVSNIMEKTKKIKVYIFKLEFSYSLITIIDDENFDDKNLDLTIEDAECPKLAFKQSFRNMIDKNDHPEIAIDFAKKILFVFDIEPKILKNYKNVSRIIEGHDDNLNPAEVIREIYEICKYYIEECNNNNRNCIPKMKKFIKLYEEVYIGDQNEDKQNDII